MSITEISVKRPATIIVVMVLLIGLGIIGYTNMGADMLPSMDVPVITVSVTYSGAGAEEIKKDVVKPVEDAVSGISGIDTISSTARSGMGMTIVTFKMGTDMNSALLDIQKAADRVRGKLPNDANDPVISKVDINAQAVMTLTVSGAIPYDQLYNIAYNIQQEIQNLPKIGQVSLQGAYKKQLSVKIDKTAAEYYHVNLNTVLAKLKSENTTIPVGTISQEKSDITVRMVGEYENINDVKNLLIPTSGGNNIRLADIADVQFGYPKSDQIVKLNGKSAIGISIQKQSDSNVVEAVNGVKAELDNIRKTLPKGVELTIADDSTVSINASLKEIKHNLIEGIITTALVLFLFLRNWRSSLIVLVAIPTSLISTFFMMYESHFTLNMMSLMGLSLCVGILVDDSIVVLENVQRHLAMGKSPIEAAIEGRKEIGMAAIAITLCDVVVFAPVAFMSGITGQMFKEFGLTVAFAALFSLFVSFTITPMLASKILKREPGKGDADSGEKTQGRFAKLFGKATEVYKRFLIWSLDNRWKIVCIMLVGVILSIALLPLGFIKTEFIPQTDNNQLRLSLSLNPGSSLTQTEAKVNQIENYLKTIREISSYYTTIGSGNDKSTANLTLRLVDKSKRKKSQSQLAADLRKWGKSNIIGANLSVSESSMGGGGGGGGGGGVSISILGTDTKVLREISFKVEEIVKSVPGVADVSNSMRADQNEIRVNIDRLACSQYGVSISDISSALRTSISGSTVGVFRDEDGTEHDIVASYRDDQVNTVSDIGSIKLVNNSGQQIPLSLVAKIGQADSQRTISRQDRLDVVRITASLQNSVLGQVNKEVRDKLSALSLPYGYSIKYGGNQQQMGDTFSSLGKALAASIVLVYMILIVLYESFMTPIIRMISLPCAAIGAFGFLALSGKTLNLMSMIGLIMLDGLASKNGTLLIDYTNTLMKRGKTLREALLEAGTTRLRPIIMTTATMIVGMLPVALSLGEGSEMKSGMGIIVIGGMITSTIFTPIILPVVYTVIDDIKQRLFKGKKGNTEIMEGQTYEA